MRYLFQGGPLHVTVVKCALVAAASLAIWTLRRYRAAIEAALLLAALYGAVVVYEIAGLVLLG